MSDFAPGRTPDDHFNRGLLHRKRREYQLAVQHLERAAVLDPADHRPHFELGLVYGQDLGQLDKSVAAFDRAIALNPAEPDAFSSRGVARRSRGDLAGAEADFRAALAISPNHVAALFNLALLRQQQGDMAETAELLLRARGTDPGDAEIRRLAAAALHCLGATHAARYVETQPVAKGRLLVPAWLAGLIVLVLFGLARTYSPPLPDIPWWISGPIILAVILGFGTWEKFRRIPAEAHLQWSLQGAARAIRKFHQGRRALERSQLLVACGVVSTPAAQSLRDRARACARYAQAHLHRTLRLICRYHGPAIALRSLDAYIALAERLEVAVSRAGSCVSLPRPASLSDCQPLLEEAECALAAWLQEVTAGSRAVAELDPVVRASGGDARNPLRTNDREALQQSQTLFAVRAAQQDFVRVRACITEIRETLDRAGRGGGRVLPPDGRLTRAIDQLDEAMADTEGILPVSLVGGESPLEMPGSATAPGILQRFYGRLCQVEAAGMTRARTGAG